MAGKTTTKPKSTARKATTSRSRSTAVKKKQKSGLNHEIVSLVIIVCGILLGIFLYIPSGVVGGALKKFFLGLWGLPVFLLPLLLIANGIHLAASEASYYKNLNKYIVLSFSLFVISALLHMASGLAGTNPFLLSSLDAYFIYGSAGDGGGIFGGFLADLLRLLVGSAGAVVILLALLIFFIMILTRWSPVKALLRVLLRSYAQAKAAKAAYQEEARNIVMEETKQPPLPKEPKRRKSKMKLFSDEDLTRSEAVPETQMEELPKSEPADPEPLLSIPEPEPESEPEEDPLDNLDEILASAIPAAKPTLAFVAEEEAPPWEEEHSETAGAPQSDSVQTEEPEAGSTEAAPARKVVIQKETETEVPAELEEGPVFERIPYDFPSIDLLDGGSGASDSESSRNEIRETAQKLVSTLKSFNVDVKLLNVSKGPTVTRYELLPGEGVKVSKIVNLSDDIALRLAATGVRIEAPIPNKEAIGIEIPNKAIATVHLREVLDSEEFRSAATPLAFGIGKDIAGKNVVFDIGKMPHVLIAGATGSGKSVCINTLITSLLYKSDPNQVKFLMVDPKVVELGMYNGIPHLLIPVVTDPKRASGALYWAVQEMVRRYKMFADNNVRDIKGYNRMLEEDGREDTMPHVVIIIDELADLMMVAPNEVEDSICRLAQMARAAGMHLVIATQRPSVDVITGIIKANIPSRIAFSVSSQVDSRTIIDQGGAEKLLGRGDMLFYPVGAAKPIRLQGAFISDKEVDRIVGFIKDQSTARYDEDIIDSIDNGKAIPIKQENDPGDNDELLPKAIEIAMDAGKVSASYLQRRLKVGFSRAARIVDQMEERGIIGPPDGSKPRELLISKEEYMQMTMRD